MKVLQVTSRYPPYTGGVEEHVEALATGLASRGDTVTVRTGDRRLLDHDRSPPRVETREGVRIHRHRSLAPGDAFHFAPGLAVAVRHEQPAILHAHNYHSFPLLLAAVGRSPSTPLVVTPHYHGASSAPVRDWLLDRYAHLGGRVLRNADAVIAVSNWERSRLSDDFGVEPRVIPNGIDVDRFADATPETRSHPYLLSVGRLERYKGVDAAINALPALPTYELLIAGQGPDRSRLEDIAAERGVDDRVEFLGFVSEERLPALYAGASVHLQLSEFESFGLTVGESLAAGTPAVVRTAGGLTDWAEREDCIGVSEGTPESIAAAVERAVEAVAPSAPLQTWADTVESVRAVYEEIGDNRTD